MSKVWCRSATSLWRIAPSYIALALIDGRSIEVYGPGADLWQLLATPTSTSELLHALAERYAVDVAAITDDVLKLLQQLERSNHVRRDDGPPKL